MEDVRQELGRRIRQLREEQGLSQDHVARAARMSRVFLGALERGEKAASIDSLGKLSKALGVALADFFDKRSTRREPASAADRFARRLFAVARHGTQAELDAIETIARLFFDRPAARAARASTPRRAPKAVTKRARRTRPKPPHDPVADF